MAKKNIDISVELLAMIDSQVKLFEGDYSAELVYHMDIPFKRSLVQARLSNLEMSRRRLEEKKELDAFSKGSVEAGGALNMLGGGMPGVK